MMKKKKANEPERLCRKLKGGFVSVLPDGGCFMDEGDDTYMCIGAEHDGHKPIFRIQGIDLEDDADASREGFQSPERVCEYLRIHEEVSRRINNRGDQAAPIRRRRDWFYFVHENPRTGVSNVVAIELGHMGILSLCCMARDIPFVLDNTLNAEAFP